MFLRTRRRLSSRLSSMNRSSTRKDMVSVSEFNDQQAGPQYSCLTSLTRYIADVASALDNLGWSEEDNRKFWGWIIDHTRQLWLDQTDPAVTINAIQTTDFGCHTSRRSLESVLAEAFLCIYRPKSTWLPIGSRNGHRFAISPRSEVQNHLEEEDDYPDPPPGATRAYAGACHFGVLERRYQDLPCPRLEPGLEHGRYGFCSGRGLLGLHSPVPADEDNGNDHVVIFDEDDDEADDKVAPLPAIVKGGGEGKEFQVSASMLSSSASLSGLRSPSWTLTKKSVRSASSSSGGSPPSLRRLSNSSSAFSAQSTMAAASKKGVTTALLNPDNHPPLHHVFFQLGRLYVSPTTSSTGDGKSDVGMTETHYVIAVDTHDRSVWMIYDAWHLDDGISWDFSHIDRRHNGYPSPATHPRFRPEHEPDWARLEGYDEHRRVMAKLADDVRTWSLGSYDASFSVGHSALPDLSIPVLSQAFLDDDHNLVTPGLP